MLIVENASKQDNITHFPMNTPGKCQKLCELRLTEVYEQIEWREVMKTCAEKTTNQIFKFMHNISIRFRIHIPDRLFWCVGEISSVVKEALNIVACRWKMPVFLNVIAFNDEHKLSACHSTWSHQIIVVFGVSHQCVFFSNFLYTNRIKHCPKTQNHNGRRRNYSSSIKNNRNNRPNWGFLCYLLIRTEKGTFSLLLQCIHT